MFDQHFVIFSFYLASLANWHPARKSALVGEMFSLQLEFKIGFHLMV